MYSNGESGNNVCCLLRKYLVSEAHTECQLNCCELRDIMMMMVISVVIDGSL